MPKALLTISCTHALEIAAILAEIIPGDEIIAPSYTFVSTVNAFILGCAKNLIEAAITPKTKAIVPMHYEGVACRMDKISTIAEIYR